MNTYRVPTFIKFVVEDNSYDRMMTDLYAGKKYVKSYLSICPHDNKSKCKCLHYKNYLENGLMMREVNNKKERVYKASEVKQLMACICS